MYLTETVWLLVGLWMTALFQFEREGLSAAIPLMGLSSLSTLVWMLVCSAHCMRLIWLRWRVKTSPEPELLQEYGVINGVPRFDSEKGIVLDCMMPDGKLYPVVLNPEWWNLLPSDLSRSWNKETAIKNSIASSVEPGKEPGSLVMLKDLTTGAVAGMGARVTWDNQSYLMTTHHTWFCPTTALAMCKAGVSLKCDLDWPVAIGSAADSTDFVLIRVPEHVWSKMGVKSSQLCTLTGRVVGAVYGGTSSVKLRSTSGAIWVGENSHNVYHKCSTGDGWSGSPLFYMGNVVGMHLGTQQAGLNRACNVAAVLNSFRGANFRETSVYESSQCEIPEEEMRSREYEFEELSFVGELADGRRVLMGNKEFARIMVKQEQSFRRKPWSQAEDEWDLGPIPSWKETAVHLNGRRAALEKQVPPSMSSVVMNGEPAPSPQKVCSLEALAVLASRLERLEESQKERALRTQNASSQNSTSTDGLKEEPKLSAAPSSFKHPGTNAVYVRKQSEKQPATSKPDIPEQKSQEKSEGTSGIKKRSRKRSRKSRGKK
uniref:Peptidase n=1 Tax=Pistacia sobemo-like virus TaxID=2794233 RepID=A0A7T0M7Y4_9VIRU|nr:peptidase [Pistacia sobemo-like virus]